MANRYDDETMKFIETRKRVAHMRREEAKRKRNIMIAIIAAVVVLVVVIVIAATSCSCGSDKEEATTVAPTTAEETTVEETTEEETTAEEFGEGSKAYVTEEGVRLRAEASTDSDIVDELSKGTEVTIISNEDDWMKVKTDSEEGYINKDYLSAEKPSGDSDDSEDVNSDNSSDDSNSERTIETRKRTINSETRRTLWSFLKVTLIANIVAVPVTVYLVTKQAWFDLATIPGWGWYVALATLVSFAISTLAVLWQTLRAARTNPAETLKKE